MKSFFLPLLPSPRAPSRCHTGFRRGAYSTREALALLWVAGEDPGRRRSASPLPSRKSLPSEKTPDPGDAKRRTLTHLQEGHADIVRLLCDGGADKDKAMQDGADAFLLRLTHLDAFLLKGPGPPPSRVPSRSRSRPSERMSAGPRLHPDHGGLR